MREAGVNSLYPPGPGATGSLLASGPQGSLYVGGYANSKRGAFLVALMSARGVLVRSFGDGGLSVLPGIYSTPQQPPRMFALAGGRLLIVGLDRAHDLVAVRLTARGRPDRGFGHDGVARHELPATHARAIIAAAAVQPGGEILVAYYRREAPQPVNEPQISPGLGEGPLQLLRLTPSGGLDRSFPTNGSLTASGPSPAAGEGLACGVSIAPDGSILIAYEQAAISGDGTAEGPAVQKLTPAGADDPSFGDGGVALLPYQPKLSGEDSSIFDAMFALPGGGVEVSFGGGGELFRFTAAGDGDPAFGLAGRAFTGPPFTSSVLAVALAPDGETFLAEAGLTVAGALAGGAPDPGLGAKGTRLDAQLTRRGPVREQQALELLAGEDDVSILAGEEIVRLVR